MLNDVADEIGSSSFSFFLFFSRLTSLLATQTKSAVETKIYLIDFAQDDKSKYEGLKALLRTLDIGVLSMC